MGVIDLMERFNPARTAFIIIDVQNDFCHQEGGFAKTGTDVIKLQTVFTPLQRVAEKARSLQIPVIFVRTVHDESNNSEAWLHRASWGPTSSLCRTGTWGTEFCGIKPAEGEIVITKFRYSAFAGTNLELVLHSLKRDSLIFGGLTTSVCVDSSLRDGLMRDFHVALLADGCAEVLPENHKTTLNLVQNYFGPVINSEQVLEIWHKKQLVSP